MRLTRQHIDTAMRHLCDADPVMRSLIRRAGPFRLRPHRDRFYMLYTSILSQQISTRAADAIRARVDALVAPERINARNLAELHPDALRAAGVSSQKSRYLLDLAEHVNAGRLPLHRMGRMPDEEVIEALIQVRGIGVWTAQMFLIFALGRPDVFPYDDLGLRTAMRNLYRLQALPDRQTGFRIAERWRPYCSVASWYCWRSLELGS